MKQRIQTALMVAFFVGCAVVMAAAVMGEWTAAFWVTILTIAIAIAGERQNPNREQRRQR